MNEIEKLKIMYNNTQNLQEKQKITEQINNRVKIIEKQVIEIKLNIISMTKHMETLWEQRNVLCTILNPVQEKIIPNVEKHQQTSTQINMLKQQPTSHDIIPEEFVCKQTPESPTDLTHTEIIVEIDLPHKWLYNYKITQLSTQIKNNRCVVKIDLDSIPQQHRHITEVSGVKTGYVDIHVNTGSNKIYNIRIVSEKKDSIDSHTQLNCILCGVRTI